MGIVKKCLAGLLAAVLFVTSVAAAPAAVEELPEEETPVTDNGISMEEPEERLPEDVKIDDGMEERAQGRRHGKTPVPPEEGGYLPGRLMVKVRQDVSLMSGTSFFEDIAEEAESMFPSHVAEDAQGTELLSDEPVAQWYSLHLKEEVSMYKAWQQLFAEDAVLYIEPVYEVKAAGTVVPTTYDPYRACQYWQQDICADEAWELAVKPGATKQQAVVAVVDSGVDLDHPDLKEQLLPGYDFVEKDKQPDDEAGHGTHVAGIIAARKNTEGVRGVAYNAKVLPVRVLDENGSGDSEVTAKAIIWAAGGQVDGMAKNPNKAHVINLSLGSQFYSEAEYEAIMFAREQGCLVVAAAGNDGLPTAYAGDAYYGPSSYPACIEGVFTVMAMDAEADKNGDWLAEYSNYDADPGG